MTARFDRDTALVRVAHGTYEGRLDRGWWVQRAPNAGYMAAIALRGLADAVEDDSRTPRSFMTQFLAQPEPGTVRLTTSVERHGSRLTFIRGRLEQGSRLIALVQATFAVPMPGIDFCDIAPPDVPPPEKLAASPLHTDRSRIPVAARYERHWAIGVPRLPGASPSIRGGWIRLNPDDGVREVDHLLVAALSDSWLPPRFARGNEAMALPPIDLTIHFRALSEPRLSTEWFLVVFRTQMAGEGFVEEDGEVWTRDGRLLAHARHLSVLLPA